MKITNHDQSPSEPARGRDNFTGAVAQELIHEHPGAVRVLMVGFESGARTHWHTHEGGQVLHIVSGEGQVQSEGEAVRGVRPGDLVVAGPGEKHWHGATSTSPMTHLAVSVGRTNWLGAGTEEARPAS